LYNMKYFIFSQALENYLSLLSDVDASEPEILLRIGRCHKGIGDYEHAIHSLELASQQRRDDAVILSELADCYSLVNENRSAKAFFREAFFLDPQAVELSYLESPMIQRLIAKLKEMGYGEAEMREWLPVYAGIYSLFNVKRELRPLELGKLKQSIYQLEHELKQENANLLLPRLINRYFWLIDHYVSASEDRVKIDEILAKIKDLDPVIYKEYIT